MTPAPPRPLSRVVLHWVRRLHLYLGLFLFPWAVLYGVTAFLFNHPAAFSDQVPSTPFGRDALADTPMHAPPSPADAAADVVAELNRRSPGASYKIAGDAHYSRDFASATAKTPAGETVTLQIAVNGSGGSLRATPPRPRSAPKAAAPFAVGARPGPARAPRGGGKGPARPPADGLKLDGSLAERVKESVPSVLERLDIEAGEPAVTAVPDLLFPMTDGDGVVWNVTHNALAGTVAGARADEEPAANLSARRFLLRLHTAHGYPTSVGARWTWAVIVDAMAFVMVFWAVSGLFMWWQLKATRRWGVACLILSAIAAAGLTVAMYRLFTS